MSECVCKCMCVKDLCKRVFTCLYCVSVCECENGVFCVCVYIIG